MQKQFMHMVRGCTVNLLAVLFFSSAASLFAQERISIKDPDITFSYDLPKGWANQDDDYYHYVLLPAANTDKSLFPLLSITYFTNNCPSLDDCFQGELNGGIQASFPAAKIGKTGNLDISGNPARWVKFEVVETTGNTKTTFHYTMYLLIQNDHYFVLSSKSPASVDKAADFTSIVRSFQSEKNR